MARRRRLSEVDFIAQLDRLLTNKAKVSLDSVEPVVIKQYYINGKKDERDTPPRFTKEVTINDVKTGVLEIKAWKTIGLTIQNATMGGLWLIDQCEFEFIEITDCPDFNGPIKLMNSTVKRLVISDSVITGIQLSKNSSVETIVITNSTIEKPADDSLLYTGFFIDSSVVSNLTISDITGEQHICNATLSSSVLRNLIISRSENVGAFTLKKEATLGAVSIRESAVGGLLVADRSDVQTITIAKDSRIDELSLTGAPGLQSLLVEESKIGTITVNNQLLPEGLIRAVEIDTLRFLNNFRKDSVLQINNVIFRTLIFEDFNNLGNLKFSNVDRAVEEQSSIEIRNSDLGKAQFIGCKLDDAVRFEFYNSKLLEIFVAGTIFPGTVTRSPTGTYREYHVLEQQQLALGQLQKVYENNGNTVQALEYQARYLKTIQDELASRLPRWLQTFFSLSARAGAFIGRSVSSLADKLSRQDRLNRKERADFVSLTLNYLSNNFGNSLTRAFWWTITISLLLFSLYGCSIGYKPAAHWWVAENRDDFFHLMSYYPEFLLPTHKSNFIEGPIEHPDMARFVDSLSRIIIAYMLYQFVQAFRKYGRRS
ncbi:hypothetical protein [Spirosoma sordidisoli]|uniref:Uncharacterized protein n=1 Tax=Spirosoma sordidisoli TaxID=2502893 RepID=A0A4Q2UNK2_9BACT|nr:hypothetical protein [Spirosoma sordidisoli]RYC69170.1 hypothetical protein EQG79_17385 [Spirosoma sordidisoli]